MTRKQTVDSETAAFERGDFDLSKMRPAQVRVGKEPKNALAIRFDVADLERLRDRAQIEGVGITQLARAWVLERLDEPAPAAAIEDLMDGLEKSVKAARVIKRSGSRKAS